MLCKKLINNQLIREILSYFQACVLSTMDSIVSFKEAREYYSNPWSIERKKVLQDLEDIRDSIQEQARIQAIGNITYSSVGLVGGGLAIAGIITAPFTFGASLGLTIAGIATSVASGVAGVTHGAVKFGKVKSQINNAKESLEKHRESCKEMMRLIGQLRKDIETIEKNMKNGMMSHGTDAFRVVKFGTTFVDIVPSAFTDVAKGVSKVSTEALSVLAAIGIILDLGSLIWNSVDLSKFNKGQLCNEADKIQKVMDELQAEYDALTKSFS